MCSLFRVLSLSLQPVAVLQHQVRGLLATTRLSCIMNRTIWRDWRVAWKEGSAWNQSQHRL